MGSFSIAPCLFTLFLCVFHVLGEWEKFSECSMYIVLFFECVYVASVSSRPTLLRHWTVTQCVCKWDCYSLIKGFC